MKVYIGPYKDWIGPYQLAELLCFWVKEEKDEYGLPRKPEWVHKFGEWLAYGSVEDEPKVGERRSWSRDRQTTWLYKLLVWVDKKKKRKIEIRIDRYDTWSMDHTLALIVLPMLKQLKETKHGSPWVDDEDVPEYLRSTAAPPKENDYDTDDNHHLRWDWVLNEMIFAFGSKLDDSWEEQFESGDIDLEWIKLENGMSEIVDGPKHTRTYDSEGRKAYEDRIQNGFRLFGKYYQNLWD